MSSFVKEEVVKRKFDDRLNDFNGLCGSDLTFDASGGGVKEGGQGRGAGRAASGIVHEEKSSTLSDFTKENPSH